MSARGWEVGWPTEVTQGIVRKQVRGIELPVFSSCPKTLTEALRRSTDAYPERDFLIDEHQRLTYQDFRKLVNNAAGYLQDACGITKGDRVATLSLNGIPFCILFYAALQLGAVAVPLNTMLKANELEYMLKNSGSKVLLMNSIWWPNIEPIRNNIPVERIFFTDGELPPGVEPFTKLIGAACLHEISAEVDEQDNCVILYTSGTTGLPKGAMETHCNAMHTAMNYERTMALDSNMRALVMAPLFHVTGLFAQMTVAAYIGGTAVMIPRYNAQHVLEVLEKEKITHMFGTPAMYVMCMAVPGYQNYCAGSVKAIGYGGSPMAEDTLQRMREWVPGARFFNAYGLTETASPATILPSEYAGTKPGSVGWPVPVGEIKVIDPETGRELGPRMPGELLVKGPMVVPGYWANPEATTKAIIDGWLHTGDMATIDEEGFVYIVDRIKDMINRGGEKVYSVEVENILYNHPKILEVAVVGVPDEVYGEAVKAVVVPRPGLTIEAEEVRNWVGRHLAKFKIPKYVEIIDILPRNPGGKVIKGLLRYIPSSMEDMR
ncbi:MAG: class I adenylate-forming enzyme family protein [Bacillota bacterium]